MDHLKFGGLSRMGAVSSDWSKCLRTLGSFLLENSYPRQVSITVASTHSESEQSVLQQNLIAIYKYFFCRGCSYTPYKQLEKTPSSKKVAWFTQSMERRLMSACKTHEVKLCSWRFTCNHYLGKPIAEVRSQPTVFS